MATLAACVLAPLFAEGFAVGTIASILGGIGGNLIADFIATFHKTYKTKGESKLIDLLQKKIRKSPVLEKEFQRLIFELQIKRLLDELFAGPEQEWLKDRIRELNFSANIGEDSSINLTNVNAGRDIFLAGRDVVYTPPQPKVNFKKFIAFFVLFILIVIVILLAIIQWPIPKMIEVTGGTYLSGKDRIVNSLPAFWIDTTPVTNQEYKSFVEATGYPAPSYWSNGRYPPELGNHPVVKVSWHDARTYAKWAKKRLPSILEWEKACRGQQGNVYPWGNEWKNGVCNTQESGLGGTSPVVYFALNKSPYGCLDMVGNVWEWVATPDDSNESFYYIIGGAFNQSKAVAKCYDARSLPASMQLDNLGFRCVSDIATKE